MQQIGTCNLYVIVRKYLALMYHISHLHNICSLCIALKAMQ